MGHYLTQRNTFRLILITFIIIVNVGCDQISKNLVRNRLHYYQQIPLVNNYFTLTKVENTGAFLGLGSDFPPLIKKVIFSILPALVLVGALFILLAKLNLGHYAILGLCFMIGGGIGNIIDRIRYNSVTDFLHLDLGIVSTGIFNLADVSIMVGLILLTLQHFFKNGENIDSEPARAGDS